MLEQRKQEERAKLRWLRSALREGLNQIDRGEGREFRSIDELEREIDRLSVDASEELAGG